MTVSTVSREVALAIERVEAEARRDIYASVTAEDRAALGIRTREVDRALALAVDREPSLLPNRALGLRARPRGRGGALGRGGCPRPQLLGGARGMGAARRDSLRNAARAGFHPAYKRPSWVWQAMR